MSETENYFRPKQCYVGMLHLAAAAQYWPVFQDILLTKLV